MAEQPHCHLRRFPCLYLYASLVEKDDRLPIICNFCQARGVSLSPRSGRNERQRVEDCPQDS